MIWITLSCGYSHWHHQRQDFLPDRYRRKRQMSEHWRSANANLIKSNFKWTDPWTIATLGHIVLPTKPDWNLNPLTNNATLVHSLIKCCPWSCLRLTMKTNVQGKFIYRKNSTLIHFLTYFPKHYEKIREILFTFKQCSTELLSFRRGFFHIKFKIHLKISLVEKDSIVWILEILNKNHKNFSPLGSFWRKSPI